MTNPRGWEVGTRLRKSPPWFDGKAIVITGVDPGTGELILGLPGAKGAPLSMYDPDWLDRLEVEQVWLVKAMVAKGRTRRQRHGDVRQRDP